MSFTWSAFSIFHLVLDSLILATFFAFFLFFQRWGPWASLIGGWVFSLGLWGLVGGRWLGFFFVARLLWTVSSVAVPLGMIYWWRRSRRVLWAAGALAILCLKVDGEVVEPRRLEVTRLTFKSSKVLKPVRISHVSDIQTDGLNRAHRLAKKASDDFDPDLVLFTGDLANHPSVRPEVAEYLKGFRRKEGAFLVGGNVDWGTDLDAFASSVGFENVEGRVRRVAADGGKISIAGLGIHQFPQRSVLRSLLKEVPAGDLILLLSHYPDAAFTVQREPVDLILSGHTHGGQVCLPWLGPVVTLSSVPRAVAAGGLHKIGTVWVLVSRGLGWEGHVAPRVRLFCRPQIVLLEIVPA